MTMNYGPDWPPRPPKRRRGLSTKTNILAVLGAFVLCLVAAKLSDRPVRLDFPRPASGTRAETHPCQVAR